MSSCRLDGLGIEPRYTSNCRKCNKLILQHQAEIERRQAMLREQQAREEFMRQLIASQEAERGRIAAELHDSLGQNATFRCRRCQKNFCPDCVHLLRLSGGQTRVFCPACSSQCESLPVPAGTSTTPTKKKESIFGRLTQTIRIRLK